MPNSVKCPINVKDDEVDIFILLQEICYLMQERESVQLCGTPVSDDAFLIRTRHRQKWYMGIRKQ